MSGTSSPIFSAVGVVTIGGRRMASEPFVFDMSGAHLILQLEPGGVVIVQGANVEPAVARFEKTCTELATFLITRNDEPCWKVEVKALFGAMRIDLVAE